jgi:hypothetical protein
MIVNGKLVKDWDKSKISTAYVPPKPCQYVSWDMERLQAAALWGRPIWSTAWERFKQYGIGV